MAIHDQRDFQRHVEKAERLPDGENAAIHSRLRPFRAQHGLQQFFAEDGKNKQGEKRDLRHSEKNVFGDVGQRAGALIFFRHRREGDGGNRVPQQADRDAEHALAHAVIADDAHGKIFA